MGKAKRSRKEERQQLADEVAAAMRKLIKSDAVDTILFGPVIPPHPEESQWSFVAFAGRGSDPHEDTPGLLSKGRDRETVAIVRQQMILATLNIGRPIVSQLFDDEADLIHYGMWMWPDRFREMRAALYTAAGSCVGRPMTQH